MTTNRHLINDYDLLRPLQMLDKGLPLRFQSGKFVVDQGWCAVITEGGVFREILGAGTHSLTQFRLFRVRKVTEINVILTL